MWHSQNHGRAATVQHSVNVEMLGGAESSSKVLAEPRQGLWFNSQNSVFLRAREMALWKKLPQKADDLNSIPKTHAKVEGEKQCHKVGL